MDFPYQAGYLLFSFWGAKIKFTYSMEAKISITKKCRFAYNNPNLYLEVELIYDNTKNVNCTTPENL